MTHPKVWVDIPPYQVILAKVKTFHRCLTIEDFVAELAGVEPRVVVGMLNNLTLDFHGSIREKPVLYAIVRALKPDIVVETGVGVGFSSLYLLEGIKDNGFGHLYSIDKKETYNGTYFGGVKDCPIGGVVTDNLRGNWTLLDEGSEKELMSPQLCDYVVRI